MRAPSALSDDEIEDGLRELALELYAAGNTACALFIREAVKRMKSQQQIDRTDASGSAPGD